MSLIFRLVLNSLCSYSDSPASVFQMVGLQAYTPVPKIFNLNTKLNAIFFSFWNKN